MSVCVGVLGDLWQNILEFWRDKGLNVLEVWELTVECLVVLGDLRLSVLEFKGDLWLSVLAFWGI